MDAHIEKLQKWTRGNPDRAAAEIERLRGHLKQHFAFARFVHLWTNRDDISDAERVSVIKHHPSLRKWVEGEDTAMTAPQENTSAALS